MTLVGAGLVTIADMGFAPDGRLYAFTAGGTPSLYRIDPATAAPSLVGPLGIGFVFEGGLAFSPGGVAYGVNGNNSANANLFTINLNTGQATVLGLIGSGQHDINGLAWRSDGQLVALDRVQNALLLIDPTTRATSVLASLGPTVGAVGGMVLSNDQGWFATSGPSGTDPGSNGLYAFDAFTGNYSLVGSFSPTITGTGISGLAISVPEPSFAGFALGWFLLWLAVRLLSKGFLGKSIARK